MQACAFTIHEDLLCELAGERSLFYVKKVTPTEISKKLVQMKIVCTVYLMSLCSGQLILKQPNHTGHYKEEDDEQVS